MRDGWTKYDGTGLKGSVALWAKDPPSSFSLTQLPGKVESESTCIALATQMREMGIERVVWCTGFERSDSLPSVSILKDEGQDEEMLDLKVAKYNPRNGRISNRLYGGLPSLFYHYYCNITFTHLQRASRGRSNGWTRKASKRRDLGSSLDSYSTSKGEEEKRY